MEQVDVMQHWETHDFSAGGECPICKRCGESPISLGMWGDEHWQETHQGWKTPCQGSADMKSEPGDEGREKFWICPLCNFLTHRPGICDQCKAQREPGQTPQPPVPVQPVAEQLQMEVLDGAG